MDTALRQVASAVSAPPATMEALHPELRAFCTEARALLAEGSDAARLTRIREGLEALLRGPSFLAAHCGPDAVPGLHLLYEDPDFGFNVISHVNDKPRTSPPHNHGDSWAIYGQAVGHTDMTEWVQVTEGEPALSRMTTTAKYRLQPGDAGLFVPGVVHSIDYPAESRFVRVTGTNLDFIERTMFDPLTGAGRTVGKPRAA